MYVCMIVAVANSRRSAKLRGRKKNTDWHERQTDRQERKIERGSWEKGLDEGRRGGFEISGGMSGAVRYWVRIVLCDKKCRN